MLGLLVCRSLLLCVLVRVFVYLRGCTCLNLFAELVIVYLCSCVGVLACTCVLSLCAVTLECDKAGKDPACCRQARLGIGNSVTSMQASSAVRRFYEF